MENKNELTKEQIWQVAVSINNSDGLMPSKYLRELIEKNTKDELTNEEVLYKLKEYYEERNNRHI